MLRDCGRKDLEMERTINTGSCGKSGLHRVHLRPFPLAPWYIASLPGGFLTAAEKIFVRFPRRSCLPIWRNNDLNAEPQLRNLNFS
jgi:hypothetical protein